MDGEKAQNRKRTFRIAAGTYSAVVCAAILVYMVITLIMSLGTWSMYSAWLALIVFATIPISFIGVIISSLLIANKIPKVSSCIILIYSIQVFINGLVALFAHSFIWALIIILIYGTNIALQITYLVIKKPTEQSNAPAGNRQ